jgi:LysR family transcriptional regulator, glycine cleavage system transcriptional activator
MRRLPYLNGVKAFEVAARCGSFSSAATELNVSPAAVSRMVRLLEERLGVILFERSANRLTLTAPGRAYQIGLSPILDALVQLTDQVKAQSGSRVLTIGVGPTFAVRWLIPRLAAFREVAPDVDVRITTGGAAAPFADDWTCGIKLGDGNWPSLIAERLFDADLIPVCAPRLARRLKSPRHLEDAALLRVAHARADWPMWLRAARLTGITATGPVFPFYGQALQAASDGVGVALGIRPYIDDDLAAGRLVAPFKLSVPKGSQWYLIFKEARREEPAFMAFQRWINQTVRTA